MATTLRCSLAVFATLALLAAPASARPQFFGANPTPGTGRVGAASSRPGAQVVVQTPPTDASATSHVAAATTLGTCPSGGRLLLNEEVVRRPLAGARVSSVVRYDGRGCFGDRDCTVSCVKVEAPHDDWRPSSAHISDGRLGGSGIQVTLQSPVGRGYSVRVLIYGLCFP